MSTNKELTARYNELANKEIKPGSYSNAKLEQMIALRLADIEMKAKTTKRSGPVKESLAHILREYGYTPKVGRALLRRHKVGHDIEDVRTFLESRKS